MLLRILSDAGQIDTKGWNSDLKSVIFFGVFILICIAAGIWWLRR